MPEVQRCASCGSGKLRDAAYFCDTCSAQLARALDAVPELEEDLTVSLTRQRGVDYRRTGSNHGKPAESPLPADQRAAGAGTLLRAALATAVRYCHAQGVRNSSPYPGLPDGKTLAGMAEWLRWRVDGLALDPAGPQVLAKVTTAVTRAERAVLPPAQRQYLGVCSVVGCDGRLYARGGPYAKCDSCGGKEVADQLRDRLLGELDDRLCTAAEIAHLSTYLGLKASRDKVRKRINTWHKRGRISSESVLEDDPAFRFGTVYRLLVQED